jgi:hypothetical protein
MPRADWARRRALLARVIDNLRPSSYSPHAHRRDDAEAKQVVSTIAIEPGVPVDAGPLSAAVYLEGLAALWVHLVSRTRLGRDFAFRVIR